MAMKILLLVFVSFAVFGRSTAHLTERDRAPEAIAVVKAVQNVFDDLKDGTASNDLKHLLEGVVISTDEFLGEDIKVNPAEIDELIDAIKERLRVEIINGVSPKSFALLKVLANLLETGLGTLDENEITDLVLSIKYIVAEIIDNIELIGDGVSYTFPTVVSSASGQSARAERALTRNRRGLCTGFCLFGGVVLDDWF